MSWTDQIRKGDILRGPSGLRVVRDVGRAVTDYGIRTSVTFTIKRCSWTGRCYTVYTSTDLRTLGYRPTGKRWPLNHKFDRMIEKEFGRDGREDFDLGCCDVIGVG